MQKIIQEYNFSYINIKNIRNISDFLNMLAHIYHIHLNFKIPFMDKENKIKDNILLIYNLIGNLQLELREV